MQLFQAKTSSKKWATMLELMAMIAIMGLWIWSMLWVIWSGVDFAKDTEDTIKAISLAREWLEGVTNWRNTNWLRFSSDKTNCWKVSNYLSSCIWNTTGAFDIGSGSYLLYTQNGAWYLSGMTSLNYVTDWVNYRTAYRAWLSSDGYFTQSGASIPINFCSSIGQTNCLTPFSREIQITPIWTWTLFVTSVVRWQGKRNREVTLTTSLTNWKAKF